jgi:tRNA U54 and U55 pseudouridine synthase Pus10
MKELKEYSVAVLSVIGAGAICYGAYGVAQEELREYVQKEAHSVVRDSRTINFLDERVGKLEDAEWSRFKKKLNDERKANQKQKLLELEAIIESNEAFQKEMRERFGQQEN